MKKFLCEEKGFAETRVENGLKRIANKNTTGLQSRIENFFGKPTKIIHPDNSKGKGKGKKAETDKKGSNKKKL